MTKEVLEKARALKMEMCETEYILREAKRSYKCLFSIRGVKMLIKFITTGRTITDEFTCSDELKKEIIKTIENHKKKLEDEFRNLGAE